MTHKISTWCTHIVSFGIPRYLPLGTVLGSLIALPLIAVWRFAYDYAPAPAMWIALGLFLVIALASLVVSRLPVEEKPLFVADKVAGLVFVFIGVPLTLKLVVIGIILFHTLRALLPLNPYDHYIRMIKFIGIEHNIFYSVLSGCAVSLLLQCALWIAR
jgi:hypothetical protein